MSDTAIIVDGIGKSYRLHHEGGQPTNFREALAYAATAPLRRFRRLRGQEASDETFWALKDVSFEVKRGEVVGIIGRNGAGKSTLLKILSRITEPTEGCVDLRGRVASLLEVGTGFHPELSGRENIYLNGAILGMRKTEIDRKFDEIVAFAEIEKFLDTPVKRYSSGMYVRLAFAVAAHLEPEILVVDEVLAVGDAAFQKKCLGKMHEVAAGFGRTVLFVSHNMPAVRSLCDSGCFLDNGRLVLRDDADECVGQYLAQYETESFNATAQLERPTGAKVWMTSATLLMNGSPTTNLQMGGELCVEVTFEATYPIRYPAIGLLLSSSEGERLVNTSSRFQSCDSFSPPTTSGTIRCNLGVVPLTGNRYVVSLFFGDGTEFGDSHVAENVLFFDVIEHDVWGVGKVPPKHTSPMWWPTRFELAPS